MIIHKKKDAKGRQKGHLSTEAERQHGSSMTSKQNRGGPASPRQSPWLHRNTRAMPTLQTHSFPLSSATLHYPVFSQARRGSAPLSPRYSVPAHRHTNKEALLRLRQGVCCPSGIRSHTFKYKEETCFLHLDILGCSSPWSQVQPLCGHVSCRVALIISYRNRNVC